MVYQFKLFNQFIKKTKDLVIGLTIAGFGLSTVLVAPLLQLSFQTLGFQSTLISFGILSTLILSIFVWLMIRKLDLTKLYIKK